MSNPILGAIQQIAREKKIPEEEILKTIEAALAAAYRKDFGNKMQNMQAQFDPKTGALHVFDVKEVVEDELKAAWEKEQAEREAAKAAGIELSQEHPVPEEGVEEEKKFNPKTMIALADVRAKKSDAAVGDEIREELPITGEFGRMAAQTAKQVIIQRLREAERAILYEEWADKAGTVEAGTIQRFEGRNVLVDFAHATAVMPPQEQIRQERYRSGQRIKFYVVAVNQVGKGPEIIVSRAHPNVVRELFAMEVPEIENGTVEIKAIAREAGSRTKIAVVSHDEDIDPIGACIGQRGARVQTVIAEIGGEKIDVILWEDNPVSFIQHALAPAKVVRVEVNEAERAAVAYVVEDQLSLAIGRAGQNVRLAAKLTGWKLNIASTAKPEEIQVASDGEAVEVKAEEGVAAEDPKTEQESSDTKPEEEQKKEEST